ncbi:MAG: hypothetical protein COW19_08945 [Zetaproteobacteria bacterium CG12_big_fil_rev_8_21_14_0_65_55_1124]|nr:MAG: hypothetical protein AUJ58_03220 [Zetaproteobacteria bacterium CG1_02_55_237]PIW42309.1 MAG: hypothetical protein COW19_08945 [Zetaproteobacteria bacterium CG12_big_fil_rev_8_21_14_0_65_55_1124]PJB80075.1 MAG: hypothetical protein CO089_08465 [Zetaproteobacteria bacterium CG_4_9_14_0_8_um_filter_55_31]
MRKNHKAILLITAIFAMIIGGVFFLEYGLNFLGEYLEWVLKELISIGKAIAGMAGNGPVVALAFYLIGNFLLTCVIFLSTGFYALLRGRHTWERVVIAGLTLIAGFSLMLIQAGFCRGFPPNVISEWLTDVSKVLFGLEGVLISYAPLYYSLQASRKHPEPLNHEYTDQLPGDQ